MTAAAAALDPSTSRKEGRKEGVTSPHVNGRGGSLLQTESFAFTSHRIPFWQQRRHLCLASPLSPSLVLGQGRVGLSAYRTELTDTPGRRAGEAAGATKSWKAVQNKKEGLIHFCLNYLNIRVRKHTGSTCDKNRFKFIDPLRYSNQPLIQSPRKDRPSLLGCSQRTPKIAQKRPPAADLPLAYGLPRAA